MIRIIKKSWRNVLIFVIGMASYTMYSWLLQTAKSLGVTKHLHLGSHLTAGDMLFVLALVCLIPMAIAFENLTCKLIEKLKTKKSQSNS